MSQVRQVKEATDIVEILGERIELQRSGTNLKAVCPFHSEKTPSFFVSPGIQRYRCFGCGESGDVLEFIQKYDGLTFFEALKLLADRANITLDDHQYSAEDKIREKLKQILELAKEYYHYLLTKHDVGQVGRDYLQDRGISNQSVKIFQLGYSVDSWDGLIKFLHKKKKYSLADLELAGLVIKGKNGRYYDRFRGRLMFPLTNSRGQTVGFSGRSLVPDAKQAKYINSPETKLYHKSELLFGYSHLYQEIRKAKQVIVAEGEMDVISSSQAHVNNIVALKGSALTEEQAKILKRTVDKVLLALDSDSAGIEATKRAIPICQAVELELRVIKLIGGKDPDDLARTDPASWRKICKNSVSVYQFFIDAAKVEHNLETPEGKRKFINGLAPIIGNIEHAVEKEFYLKQLASLLKVSVDVVRSDIQKFKHRGEKPTGEVEKKDQSPIYKPKTRRESLEEFGLFLLMRATEESDASTKNWSKMIAELSSYTWSNNLVKNIYLQLTDFSKMGTDLTAFTSKLPADISQLAADIYLHPKYSQNLADLDISTEWQHLQTELKKIVLQEEITVLTTRLDELDTQDEKTAEQELEQRQLLAKIVELQRQ